MVNNLVDLNALPPSFQNKTYLGVLSHKAKQLSGARALTVIECYMNI